jgi:excinuclease ABC subunit B
VPWTRPRAAAACEAAYNREHGIEPTTIRKAIAGSLIDACESDYGDASDSAPPPAGAPRDAAALAREIAKLRKDMREAARALEFEQAATLRDRVRELEGLLLGVDPSEVDAG